MSTPEEKTNSRRTDRASDWKLQDSRASARAPSPPQIRIRVHAASLNYPRPPDRTRQVQSHERHPPAARPALRRSGEVVEPGRGGSLSRSADRVASAQIAGLDGGARSNRERALGARWRRRWFLPELQRESAWLSRFPMCCRSRSGDASNLRLDRVENALFECGDLKPGETVLVQGSGGVSIFALQFALAAGARVFAITGSQAKIDRLERLGAEHVIRYEREPSGAA